MVRKRPGSGDYRNLRRDVEIHRKKYTPVDQLVDYLRSTYPNYARLKLQPFTKRVNDIITRISPSKRREPVDDSSDDGDVTPSTKKRRGVDEREERLCLLESQHLRNRNADVVNSRDSSSSSALASTEEASMSDDDAIYGEKFEPEFDLMKSMLRKNLLQKSKESGGVKEVNEVVELEVDDKDAKKVSLVNEEHKLSDDWNKINQNDSSGKSDSDANKPMFKDLGGMSEVIEELKMEVIVPMYNLPLVRHLGGKPMAGVLLHGPPGCGKTTLAHAIANETGVPFYKVSATELVSGVSGGSEENIRELFSKAHRTAPSIVFIDEIDAIGSKRENLQREMERRIVTQLMTCMDESHRPNDENASSESSDYVLVIGATNRPDAIDPALRRPGRFDREFFLGVPDESARLEILSVLTSKLKVEDAFDLVKIAKSTPGFAGTDLAALANKAVNLAIRRIIAKRKDEFTKDCGGDWWRQQWSRDDVEKHTITMADFEEAAKMVQPSSRREGFSTIPNVKWDDVGGLHFLRKQFDRHIVRRIKFPEDYEESGVDLETGILLYGPPGCGKTLIAKAVANEAGASFIHIKGPELLNKYVGESELAVRSIFTRARICSPCILFFDEVDALTTKRGKEGGWVVERLLNQLLVELDGADNRKGVYVIGATNRPEVMDSALLRPGRLGKLMYVPLPSPDERGMILKALARKKPVDANVDLMALGKDDACKNLSGADLSALMNEAAMVALDDKLTSSAGSKLIIKDAHFKIALGDISPSVSDKEIQYYTVLSQRFKAA